MTDDLNAKSVWGGQETQFFFALSPDRVLAAIEALGLPTTGRCLALNSMENRVFDVEIDGEGPRGVERERVVKFYRPGRWSKEQILEEHNFLLDLVREDLPVIAPLEIKDGSTLATDAESGIHYAIFPKRGGRAPDELSDEQLRWLGRLLARVHAVGRKKEFQARLELNPDTYGYANLDYLLDSGAIPLEMQNRYRDAVEEICEIANPWFAAADCQRIHGDCHLGNFLWRPDTGPMLLDFDDTVSGAPVQDLWLLFAGREEETKRQWELCLEAYESMSPFDRSSLRLVEALRALRFVHFSAWIGKRWQDPAFQSAFPHYGSFAYWQSQTMDLEEQVDLVRLAQDRPYFDTF